MSRRASSGRWGTPSFVGMSVMYLMVILTVTQMGDVASARSWVKIRNDVGPGQRVWVSCYYTLITRGHKTPVTIDFGQEFYIRFHQVHLVKTKWWCAFEWENTHQNQTFTVWDHTKTSTMPVGCSQCFWSARSDGWYYWDKNGQKFKFYKPWLKAVVPPGQLLPLPYLAQNSSQTFGLSPKAHTDSGVPDFTVPLT